MDDPKEVHIPKFIFFKEFVVHSEKPYFGFIINGKTIKFTPLQNHPVYVCEAIVDRNFIYTGDISGIKCYDAQKENIELFIKQVLHKPVNYSFETLKKRF